MSAGAPGQGAVPAPVLPLDDVGALMDALAARGDVPPTDDDPREGRVLQVVLGYNPNSSSLGTSVVMLLWGMGAATLILQATLAVLLSARLPPPDPEGGP